jgi:2',3'-cyclic-nucleotide 2'-phosphodiesterase (5'-nucleotidase family)
MARGIAVLVLAMAFGGAVFGAETSGRDVPITILQTTDLHHHANGADHVGLDVDPVSATSTIGAYARIAAYVNRVRATAGHSVVLVDSGDWTMGTLYDLTLGSQPLALYFLDLLGYDCVTLGNHEFDYGPDGLARILGTAQSRFGFHTPIVASNMSIAGTTALASFVGPDKPIQSFRVQELARGVKVGYIGLMGKGAALAAPTSAPVVFADPATQYAQIQALVDSLRRDQDVNIVVALSHSGTDATGSSGEDVELARHVKGLNVIASGHTHTPLPSARTVANGTWNTFIVDAGAFGTNVARIDLTYHRNTKTTTLDASSNAPMTDATLAGYGPDPVVTALVRATDLQLNATLAPLLSQTFPDYDPANVGKGIYHPVGATLQDMVSNEADPAPAPNGLGDLAADAVRAVPNGIIAQTLAAVGGNPANLPGYDFTPVQLGVVATGVLRGKLRAGVPLTFADVYDVLPLGITPDTSQALPLGFPLVTGYLELEDVKKLCALQLVVQSDLAAAENYLNLSGIRCGLKGAESAAYFKSATAAGVLGVTSQKAAAGSAPALAALAALSTLGTDGGAALLAAAASGNLYAAAMVKLNDGVPSAANLAALGQVAGAAAAGGNALPALVVSKAIAAIDGLAGFGAADAANIGSAVDLAPGVRVRVAADLYATLSLNAVQQLFGTTITVYTSPGGPPALSLADLMAHRIDIAPALAGVQELKEWMALLSYLGGGLQGLIGPVYASTGDFTQFGSFGLAVTNRNVAYPAGAVGQLVGTLAKLKAAP